MLKTEIVDELVRRSELDSSITPQLHQFASHLYNDIMCSIGAHALQGYSALDMFKNIKQQYEE